MSEEYTVASLSRQKRYTRALIKFCVDHKNKSIYMDYIRDCLVALEADDVQSAYNLYEQVPLGGNGCFNDWWPPVVFEYEDENYVWSVFESLVNLWSSSMRSLKLV